MTTPAWHLCDVCDGSGLYEPWNMQHPRTACFHCRGLGRMYGVWTRDNAGHLLFVDVKQRRWAADGLNAAR